MNKRYLESFLEMLLIERNVSKNTIDNYFSDLSIFFSFNSRDVKDITIEDVNNYILYRRKNNTSVTTIIRNISVLKRFFKYLLDEKIINTNPIAKLTIPKRNISLPKVLSFEEIKKIILVAHEGNGFQNIKMATMLEMMYSNGMRVSELLSIKMSDLNNLRNGNYIYITGKGSKERMVPFTGQALDSLHNYVQLRESNSMWLFPKDKRGKKPITKKTNIENDEHMTRQGFAIALKKIALKAGISPSIVSPHILRHSFATHMIGNDVNIKIIQDILGHVSIKTTQIYTHVANLDMKNIINEKHPLVKSKNI